MMLIKDYVADLKVYSHDNINFSPYSFEGSSHFSTTWTSDMLYWAKTSSATFLSTSPHSSTFKYWRLCFSPLLLRADTMLENLKLDMLQSLLQLSPVPSKLMYSILYNSQLRLLVGNAQIISQMHITSKEEGKPLLVNTHTLIF